jgi:type IV secretion system protein VirB1
VPLVVTESGGDPLRIHVNRGPLVRAASVASGAAIVRRYMAAGYTVDVGLAQVNSANFARLGVTIEQVFDPCTNLGLASILLQTGYGRASRYYTGVDAISATYSLYNTGTMTGGVRNGYAARIWAAATAMGTIQAPPSLPGPPQTRGAAPSVANARRDQAAWVMGQLASADVEVFK